MNDYVDEPLDRLACRREKPLVAGDLSRDAALAIWVATALLGFAASYAFNLATAAIAIVLWLLGVSYNFWAKRTRLSWLPFAGFYPSLPLWGFVAAGKFTPALLLTYPVCAPLAVALNIANTLPDLESDLAGGVKGFTHRLGQSRALFLLWFCLAATMILMAAAGVLIGGHLGRLIPGMVAGAFLLGAMMADWAFLRSPATLRRTFYLSAAGALLLGCAWIVSLP
jgi:4-hydroxybenzoate polyprenyltransferase